MFWEKDFVCRLCLLSDLHAAGFEKVFENDVTDMSCLATKISTALKWKVCPDDGLPNFVCKGCIQKLDLLIFCNTWTSKVVLGFEEIQSLFSLYCKQGDDTARSILLSIFKKRSVSKIDSALVDEKLDTTTTLVSQVESMLSKIETMNFCVSENENNISDCFSLALELPNLSSPQDLEHFCTSPVVEDEMQHPSNMDVFLADAEDAADLKCNSDETPKEPLDDCSTMPDVNSTESHKLFVCPECPVSFPKKSLLWKHLTSHKEALSKYQCSQCTRKFLAPCELDRHIRAHKGLKPYKCSKCDQFFSQKNLLANHMNWHEGRKGHLCEICGESLSSRANLMAHISYRHSVEKKRPFKCDQCGKCFARNHHLENHKTTHKESRPHQCTTCGVTFKRLSQLQEHENVHSGEKEFQCEECNRCFRTKRVLNVHKLVHAEQKPHQCSQCSKSYVRRGGLMAHLKSHKT